MSSDSLWKITSPPIPPRIDATILDQNGFWNLTTQTYTDSNLIVLQNTILTLVCVASYPVIWRKDEKYIPQEHFSCYENQTCLNSPSDELPRAITVKWCSTDRSSGCIDFVDDDIRIRPRPNILIPVDFIKEYHAVIKMSATEKIEGTYICGGSQIQLVTSAVIKIRPEAKYSRSQLLQGGFDKVHLFPELYKQSQYFLDFIYYMPGGTFYNPNIYSGDAVNCGSNYSFLPQRLASPNVAIATVCVYVNTIQCNSFRVVPKDDAGNEIKGQSFKVSILKHDESAISIDQVRYVGGTDIGEDNVVLTNGWIFSVSLEVFHNPGFLKHWLEITEVEPVYTRYESCSQTAMSKETAERCGVIKFSAEHKNASEFGTWSVRLILNATRPCTLIIRRDGYLEDESNFTSNMDMNDESKFTISTRMVFVRTLHVAVADKRVFGLKYDGVKVKSVPSSDTSCGIEVYINQSLELQCLIPVCQMDRTPWWCKREDNICENATWRGNTDMNEDSSNSINSKTGDFGGLIRDQKLDLYTLVIRLKLSQIQKPQEGSYQCSVLESFPLPSSFPKLVTFHVKVSDPIKPFFTDNKEDATVVAFLSPNATLDCPVQGRPQPNISWNCSSTENCPSDIDSWNISLVEVNKPGIYICQATSGYGMAKRSYDVRETTATSRNEWLLRLSLMISLPIVFAILLATLIFLLIGRWIRNKRLDVSALNQVVWRSKAILGFQAYFKELADLLNSSETLQVDSSAWLNDQTNLLPYKKDFEIDHNYFSTQKKLLGVGEFGRIYMGQVKLGGEAPVAVKTPRDPSNPYHYCALLDELRVMCHIRPHVNVLSLIGACTSGIEKRQLFILTEFCEYGSLKDYLVENRNHFEALEGEERSVQTLLNYAYQAANGMVHLATENIIHRDLALRNLLLTGTQIVKISDFGMSRRHESVYRKPLSQDVPIPIFWMAYESLFSDQYTQKSDVWAFGVVLWEIFNCGRRPYPDHEPDMAFRSWLRASEENRLGPPKIVCEEIYHLMRDCWKIDPAIRPTFTKCKRQIAEILERKSSSMYFSLLKSLRVSAEATMTVIFARNQQVVSCQTEHRSSNGPPSLPDDIQDGQSEYHKSHYFVTNGVEDASGLPCDGQMSATTIVIEPNEKGDEKERLPRISPRPYVKASRSPMVTVEDTYV